MFWIFNIFRVDLRKKQVDQKTKYMVMYAVTIHSYNDDIEIETIQIIQ